MYQTKEAAQIWLRSVARAHLPTNALSFTWSCYTRDHILGESIFGAMVDARPQQGKVVEITEDWLLLKTARCTFYVVARDMLPLNAVEACGIALMDEVCVTPYCRRNFGGRRLDAPTEEQAGGVTFQVTKLGASITELPVDKTSLHCNYLRDMIQQVEELRAPDGIRTIAQLLVDAGGANPGVTWLDVATADLGRVDPTLTFRINCARCIGQLSIRYRAGADVYEIGLETGQSLSVTTVRDVHFNELGSVIESLVGDDMWRLASIQLVKQAAKRIRRAA